MAVFDLIYPEISGHMNGFDRLIAFLGTGLQAGEDFLLDKEFHWLEIVQI